MACQRLFRCFLIVAIALGTTRAAEAAQESLGTKIKKVLQPSPTPSRKHRKKKSTPTPAPESSPKQKKISPTPSPSPTSKSKSKRKKPSPTPAPEESPSPSPAETETSSPSERPGSGKKGWPNVSLSPDQIQGYENYPTKVKQILDAGLALTKQNLGYSYGSADPKNSGMDCSGFIYYVLSKCGVKDVPRDARQQYIWVRKAGNFQAVLAQRDDTFELDALTPGDLLFWASTYGVSRDPDITQTMIYLGREMGTNQRIMIGASERLAYKGQSRSGVNIFDFKVGRAKSKSNNEPGPVFVGYGRIPDLGTR